MTAGDTIARECEVQSPTLDKIFTDMLEEMHRRMGNEKYIWETAEDFSTNPEWLPVDDTQIGIEFAFEYLRPFLGSALTASGHRIVGPADMEKAVEVPKLTGQMIEAAYQASPIYELSQKWQRHEGVMRSGDFSYEFLRMWDAAHAASPHMPVPAGWQPIETAPKDGTVIDLWHEEWGRQTDCYWGAPHHECGEAGKCCDSDWHGSPDGWVDSTFNEFTHDDDFTHWMMPAAAPLASRPKGGA